MLSGGPFFGFTVGRARFPVALGVQIVEEMARFLCQPIGVGGEDLLLGGSPILSLSTRWRLEIFSLLFTLFV